MTGYEMDTDYLQKMCDDLAIPLHLEEIEVDLMAKPDKSPCFVCSWHRRKTIFAKSKELVNIIEKMNKGARKNMFRAMDNLYPEYLPRF